MLAYKIKSVPSEDLSRGDLERYRSGSISEFEDHDSEDRFNGLVGALVRVIDRARGWLDTESMSRCLDDLPKGIQSRVRVWMLVHENDVTCNSLIDAIADAIALHNPNLDDVNLLKRVIIECEAPQYTRFFEKALGTPPSLEEVGQRLAAGPMPPDWWRVYHWSGILPDDAIGEWTAVLAKISDRYEQPLGRESYRYTEPSIRFESMVPMPIDELKELPALEAAKFVSEWRPPAGWRDQHGAQDLGWELEATAKRNPSEWGAAPLQISTALQNPIHITHYLRALAEIYKVTTPPIGELVELMVLLQTGRRQFEPLGPFDHDSDVAWKRVDQASVEVITIVAQSGSDLGALPEAFWEILMAGVKDRSEQSSTLSKDEDPHSAAINRPCTRALRALLVAIGYECRYGRTVPIKRRWSQIQDCLKFQGIDGLQFRSVIGSMIWFLQSIVPEWVDDNRGMLFGEEAPDDLGQRTFDQALRYGRPRRWLLESHRSRVMDAVSRGETSALRHVMLAVIADWDGYSAAAVVNKLRDDPKLLSASGVALGKAMRDSDNDEYLERTLNYWQTAIETKIPDGLVGFGWLAVVHHISDESWVQMTLETLEITRGRTNMPHYVSERAARVPPSAATLEIVNHLVRATSHPGDNYLMQEHINRTMFRSEDLSSTAEYRRLVTALRERGYPITRPSQVTDGTNAGIELESPE